MHDTETITANRHRAGALAGLSLAILLSSLGTSIANVALPTLADVFAAPFQHVQWVVLAYLLTSTVLIASIGRLGDLFGRRRLLLAGLAVFSAASLLAGLSPSLPLLIAARAVQGAGAAAMMALAMAFVSETVPKERIGSVMGLLGTMSAVGTALGPSLGGLLISGFGWHAIFLVAVPFGLSAFALVHHFLPDDRKAATTGRFDLVGAGLLAATLAAYALAMTVGEGRVGPLNVALVAASAVGAGLFVLRQRRIAFPLIRPAAFRRPGFPASLAANILVATVIMVTLVVGPFYLSRTLGLGPAHVGFVLAIGPVVSVLTGVVAGRFVDRFGATPMVAAGLATMVAGTASLPVLSALFGLSGYITAIVVLTPGYQLFQAANNAAVMTGVPAEERGITSGLLNLSRNLGLITGASLMGAIFTLAVGTKDMMGASAPAVATGMHVTFAVAAVLLLAALTLVRGVKRKA
ncbi:MFS transporter [Shinella kummerowiae]|jgi:EmrB/QacA subfamily drug resistance transporter|uniref:MFS transporter n=1 Tax=Shinella kummerowiae TaxID=417745 RepID=A0A6N8SG12_9HYPH|nr:MFS transporter [Shinella kummerowiae]MXN47789.1 MFS transporter [Shinella kummerowiae]